MAKKTSHRQLRMSRIDFYRFRGQEFFEALFKCIDHEVGEGKTRVKSWAKLNPHQQGVYAWWCFWGDVENGGLTQYFYNNTDEAVPALESLLKASGNAPMAALVSQATKVYRKHKKHFAVENPFGDDGLFARMTELTKLDRPIVRQINRTAKQLEKWLRANMSLVAVGDTGEPIDPAFTGEIETHHASGKVFEQAAIRRGVLSGPYRRYFDDGTLEHTCFYAAGEISADYWPSGQPKHKTMKSGKLKIDEWYYPSGKLQKRYVADKDGDAAEPVRVWHENGQLAEEMHMRKGDKYGPWLKYFADGSPRLVAEHGKGESFVVKNAWNDEGEQVVRNGRGTYFDDGLDISWPYDLSLDGNWTTLQELRDGIPNGVETRWHVGVLWSKGNYVKGKPDGVHTLFYDNGPVRSLITYRNGREGKTEEFPKFDHPRPAVLIRFEANAELYEAWKHPLLDVYPTPRNLDEVQAQLAIPPFLQEVFERNLANAVEDQYEDLNTFDDGVTYMVMVDERGNVEKAEWSGASPYSGGMIELYPPIIQKLKFNPGQVRGRNVRCRVVVSIDHTFVESSLKR